MDTLPTVLRVKEVAPNRWEGAQPDNRPEGRDVVFSGQLLAQMIMASTLAIGHNKELKSIHAVFARPGRYSTGPIEYHLDPMHDGRAFASNTITAVQDNKLLSRGLVLLNAVEPDLMRHSPAMPTVPAPADCEPATFTTVFPTAEVRPIDPNAINDDSGLSNFFWLRTPHRCDSIAAAQAIIAWSQPGFIIGVALRAHPDEADYSEVHRSIATGVISHSAHFHEHADVSDWLLVTQTATYAGHGRVYGTGAVYTHDGQLVSTFAQDSMARRVDPTTSNA